MVRFIIELATDVLRRCWAICPAAFFCAGISYKNGLETLGQLWHIGSDKKRVDFFKSVPIKPN
jgi:hypothetical protein